MNSFTRRVLFLLFFVSGFSSLVYQVVWTRMAFASFGIIPPVLSVVLSVFMLGLALGSWAGGRWIMPLTAGTGWSAAFFYAGAELVIGLGAFAVPKLFAVGENLLLGSGQTNSFNYLFLSALVLAASILPWCVCMGTTFPFMMAYVREREREQTKSFSFLYLANVLGAMTGTALSALIYIELFGFHHTLWLAAAGNAAIAFASICLGIAQQRENKSTASTSVHPGDSVIAAVNQPKPASGAVRWILFSTGFIVMAMEVVWTRAFTPVLKTQVYSFALIIFTYLGATFLGSWIYRRHLRANRQKSTALVVAALAVMAWLPVLANNPAFLVENYWESFVYGWSALLLLGSIIPFCALLGYLTPGLIDEYAGGNPGYAGRAYALNVLGCILGPLFAGYLLLPHLSERYALMLLAVPLMAFCYVFRREYSGLTRQILPVVLVLAVVCAAFGTEDFETMIKKRTQTPVVVRRDYAATVVAAGAGSRRLLLVNGIGMTMLTPITKFMVHLPLACHKGPPKSVLVICFGMGTSFRSAVSWGIDATAVELVPSVPKMFGFYHADADRCLNVTNGHIVIDDGRRFLRRTDRKFDVIIVDPPPPVQAAGSSLLFSKEFYDVARQHLNPGGIIQMWYPGNPDTLTGQATLRSICDAFPYVRSYVSVKDWGMHLLGSMEPIEELDGRQMVARMPAGARQDLVEWYNSTNAAAVMNLLLRREFSTADALNPDTSVHITDDDPFNEYYMMRELLSDKKNSY